MAKRINKEKKQEFDVGEQIKILGLSLLDTIEEWENSCEDSIDKGQLALYVLFQISISLMVDQYSPQHLEEVWDGHKKLFDKKIAELASKKETE